MLFKHQNKKIIYNYATSLRDAQRGIRAVPWLILYDNGMRGPKQLLCHTCIRATAWPLIWPCCLIAATVTSNPGTSEKSKRTKVAAVAGSEMLGMLAAQKPNDAKIIYAKRRDCQIDLVLVRGEGDRANILASKNFTVFPATQD